jgi:hypothetical protein
MALVLKALAKGSEESCPHRLGVLRLRNIFTTTERHSQLEIVHPMEISVW